MLDIAEYHSIVERSPLLMPEMKFDTQAITICLNSLPLTEEFQEWTSCLVGSHELVHKVVLNYVNYTAIATPWIKLSSGKDLILFKMVWAQSLTYNSFMLA